MTQPPPFALVVTLTASFTRSDDPRPVAHRVGTVTLTHDDRHRWRVRLADALDELAAALRAADDPPTTEEDDDPAP